ncbi:MAG: STAS domain-containing protein [Actinomycetota bacterium]
MTAHGFAAAVRSEPGRTVLDLSGTLNSDAELALYSAYDSTAEQTVLLNFQAVDYINSTGIAVLVGLLSRARGEGRTVGAFGLLDHYREIFEITRLVDFMDIYPDESAATGGVAAGAS